ncbi:MAG TPA: transcription antitermination factor NusB [Thermoleophilia bacterium]|nr:transcription antitermination factor NusB [Thermoleophilia bacterium]
MSPAGPSRKQARRDAVFLLYQTEVTDLPMADLVRGQKLREGYAPDDFTVKAVAGVLRDRQALDAELEAHAEGWPLDRMAPLERSVLRLALWEIRSGGTPPEVAIDEAVRLAKRYSTDEAGAFVNGVLGGIVGGDEAEAQGGASPDDADEAQGGTSPDGPDDAAADRREDPGGGEEAGDG